MILNTLIPLFLAFLPLSIGIGALFFPNFSSAMYGVPTKERGFVMAAGVRDLFIALVIFELWRENETRLLFLSIFALGLISAGDAGVTWVAGNRKRSPLHLLGALILFAYSAFMLARGY